ncbi:hypothetical protein TFLX_03012 [Thermoflexales bacterium]|nr:hypothetical protein TFLX_03012 [Thermoflexales bacterium]
MRQVFPFSDTIRPYGPILLGLVLLLHAILVIPVALLAPTEKNLSLIWLMIVICLPFDLIGLYITVRHMGQVILTDEAIILQRWGREQRLLYNEITDIQPRDRHIPPNLVFHAPSRTLRFSRMLENFPQFYATLEQQIPTIINTMLVPGTLPGKLQVTRSFWSSRAALLVILLAVAGLISLALGYDTAQQTLRPTAFLLTLLIGVGLTIAALIGELDPSQPWHLLISSQSIEAFYLLGQKKQWPTEAIEQIQLREEKSTTSLDTAHIPIVKRSVVIEFKEQPPLILAEKRANDFGYAPEQIYTYLHRLYAQYLSSSRGERTMDANQSQANSLIQQAQEWQKQSNYAKAIEAYEQAIALFPPYASFNLIVGDLYFRLQNYTAASQAYWAVLETIPEHAQAWSSLGQCLLLLKQVSKAVEAFDHAVEIDDQLVEAWYYGALAYGYLGQIQETKERLQRALQLRPDWEAVARQEPLLKAHLPSS